MIIIEDVKITNIQAEICLVGAMFQNPDLYVTYGNAMRSKYDFSDEAVRFFYDSFETYYLTFSETVDETKMNVFMSQDEGRLRLYQKYHGWKTIQQYIDLSDKDDCKNYFNIVKKYSLLREYARNGFPSDKIIQSKKFDKFSASDIYRIIGDEAVDLTINNETQLEKYLNAPNFGLPFPWQMYNEYFLGMRNEKLLLEGFTSNSGKSRKLMFLAAYTALVQHQKFLFISNEMGEEDLRSCLMTTVINNKPFQELHGVKLQKPEKEIVLGVYHDRQGDIIRKRIDENGIVIETNEDFIKRVKEESDEYWQCVKVMQWIDKNDNGNLMFKDVGDDYSTRRIEFELRKAKVVNGIKYYGYDTLKSYKTEDWADLKQTTTRLKELTKELKMFGFVVYQLTDSTIETDVMALSSLNIASAKSIKHVCDMLTIGKAIDKSLYYKYQYIAYDDDWGEPTPHELDLSKTYFAIKIDKNRSNKRGEIMLFEINLDYNIWNNIGYLVSKNNTKRE